MRLTEVLMALLLGLLVVRGAWTVAERGVRASRMLMDEAAALEASRLASGILDRELAGGRAGEDWRTDPAGVALRVFRGWGFDCGGASPGATVRYRGLRQPDPAKDSLELVSADGRRSVVALAAVEPPPSGVVCPSGGRPLRLRWNGDDTDGETPVLVRLFETGLYAANDAFRYRRGAAGRQPLTAAVLDPARTRLDVRAGAVELVLAVPWSTNERRRRWVP